MKAASLAAIFPGHCDSPPDDDASAKQSGWLPTEATGGTSSAAGVVCTLYRAAPAGPLVDRYDTHWAEAAAEPVAHRRAHAGGLEVVVVEKDEALTAHMSAWQDLADNAMEANVFYEPWLLRPALKNLHREAPVRLVFIYERTPGASRLCGFFPLEPDPRFRKAPLNAWRLLRHLHCFLCTPLIRKDRARATLGALLQWAGGDGGIHLLDFSHVRGDGPFHELLFRQVDETGARRCVTNRFARALWKAGQEIEDYLQATLSKSVRKEYRRQRKRLGELGRLEFRTLRDGGEVDGWLDEFLGLEASGWKAREGQALALTAGQRTFVRTAAQLGFARGQVLLQGLFLDGRPVAMLLSFLAGSGGFAFKIAYDEALAKYSPGVQMMLDILGSLHSDSRFTWMDSCAEPDHPMINRLWKDQKIIESVLASTGSWRGDLAVALFPAGQRLVRLIRALRKMKPYIRRCAAVSDAFRVGPDPMKDLREKVLHGLR